MKDDRITISIRKDILLGILCTALFAYSMWLFWENDFHAVRIPDLLMPSGKMPLWYVQNVFWRMLAVVVVQLVSLLSARWLLVHTVLRKATPEKQYHSTRIVIVVLIILQAAMWFWKALGVVDVVKERYHPDKILPLLSGTVFLAVWAFVRRQRKKRQPEAANDAMM